MHGHFEIIFVYMQGDMVSLYTVQQRMSHVKYT